MQHAFDFLAKEDVTYYPEGNVAAPVIVEAVVFWRRTSPSGQHLRRAAELYIPVLGLEAVGVTEVHRGRDLVDVLLHGQPVRLLVTSIIDSDPGVFRLLGVD